jgi:hypothetical protein
MIGPAPFDVMDAEFIELFGDPELIGKRQVDSEALIAVAQCCIVERNFLTFFCFHGSGAGIMAARISFLNVL